MGLSVDGVKGNMKTELEYQIKEIFGTVDPEKLRQIAKNAECYLQNKDAVFQNRKKTGRKNSFTEQQIANILALQDQGIKIADIARQYQVSRQTIYNQIERAHHFSEDSDTKMRMYYMNHNDLCTIIDVDFKHEKVKIKNYTEQLLFRAFGIIENPTWNDFQHFLEDRCFPKTRDHAKEILKEMNLPFYDPLLIIEQTRGRMAGDHQWILILYQEG